MLDLATPHPTTGGDDTLSVGHDAHIMPQMQMLLAEKAAFVFTALSM